MLVYKIFCSAMMLPAGIGLVVIWKLATVGHVRMEWPF